MDPCKGKVTATPPGMEKRKQKGKEACEGRYGVCYERKVFHKKPEDVKTGVASGDDASDSGTKNVADVAGVSQETSRRREHVVPEAEKLKGLPDELVRLLTDPDHEMCGCPLCPYSPETIQSWCYHDPWESERSPSPLYFHDEEFGTP